MRAPAPARVAWLGLLLLLVLLVDRVAMHTWLDRERRFLEDIDHRPKPDAVEFNEHGIRDTRGPEAFPESAFNIVVLGDSFVYGFGLHPLHAIPQQIELRLRRSYPDRPINVANFGYISSSPYLSLRQLRDFGHLYHPDLVLLCVDMTDFHDDIKYELYDRKPGWFALLRFLPSGFFALKHATHALGLHDSMFGYPSDRFFVVNRPLEETRPYLAWIQKNIDAIDDFVRTRLGARFALAILPRPFQYSRAESPKSWERGSYTALGPYAHEPFRYFGEIGKSRRYPIRSLLPAFERTRVFPTAFRGDPHWNVRGARVAVDALLAFLEQERLLDPAPDAASR
jgi:hypothetical protein